MASGINVKFGATDAGFTSTVSKVNKSVDGMDKNVRQASSSVRSSFAGMVKAGAALAVGFGAIRAAISSLNSVMDNFGDAIELGGRLAELKLQTGETAGNLMVLERAFNNSGVGAEKVGTAMNKMQKFMAEAAGGGKSQEDAMIRLGISLSDLSGKTPMEQMRLFAERIAGIESPTARASLAAEVFGTKLGGKLLPLLLGFSGEINTAKGELRSMPGVMDRSSEAFDMLSDKMAVIKSKSTEIAAGFIEKALPALNAFVERIAGFDAAGWGGKLAENVLRVSDILAGAFVDGVTFAGLIGEALKIAAAGFGNYIINGFGDAYNVIRDVFGSRIPKLLIDRFKASWEVFRLMGEHAIEKLRSSGAMNNFAATLNTIFDGITNTDGTFDFDTAFAKYKNAGKAASDEVGRELNDRIAEALDTYDKSVIGSTEGVAAEWDKIIQNFKKNDVDIFGVGGSSQSLKDKLKSLEESGKAWRDEMTKGSQETKDKMQDVAAVADTIPANFAKINRELSLSEEIAKRIKKALSDDNVDPGGRLEKLADEQIKKGRFRSAGRTNERIKRNEENKLIRDTVREEGQATNGRAFGRSIQDIAKDNGVDTFRKTSKQLREEIAERIRKQNKEMDARNQGKPGKGDAPGKPAKEDPMSIISKAVEEIRTLVKKIEPKLPTAALAN